MDQANKKINATLFLFIHCEQVFYKNTAGNGDTQHARPLAKKKERTERQKQTKHLKCLFLSAYFILGKRLF